MTARRRLVRQLAVRSAVVDADRAESVEHEGPKNPMPMPARRVPASSALAAGAAELQREINRLAPMEDPLGGRPIPADARSTLLRRRGRGNPLPEAVSAGMAAEFGRPFSSIRVHTDPEADRLARSMQSVALTHGSDIYFSRGSYAPTTASGSHLLAHELAHAAGGSHGGAVVGRADDPAEAAADRTADRIAPAVRRMMGEPGSASRFSTTPVQAGAAKIEALQRKMSYTSAHINDHRSKTGVRKGQRSDDSLHKIGRLLDMMGRGFDTQEKDMVSLRAIDGLCSTWLAKHRNTKNAELLKLVTDIKAEAVKDADAAARQRKYVNDVRAGHRVPEGKQKLSHSPTLEPFNQQIDQQANNASASRENASKYTGEKDTNVANPFHSAESWLIRAAGLTEAEILAIKAYTAGDYRYINPAVAESREWMEAQLAQIQGRMRNGQVADLDQRAVEGKRHADMMIQGLAKLPPRKGTVHRGQRMSPEEFAKVWKGKKELTYPAFTSSSTDTVEPDKYAAGLGGGPRDDQTVSVRSQFAVTDARDVQGLSNVKSEKEWLLLPGTSFTIDSIKPAAIQLPGKPQATEWWEITLTQKPKTIP